MYPSRSKPTVKPRIIIHGGAGNITRSNLTAEAYHTYREAMLIIVRDAHALLTKPGGGATALDVATHAVTQLENNPLFNSGRGAVFTRAGTHELEASVMVSRGYRKRGVGVMKLRTVKNPITLAREMLIRGNESDGGGAQGHCQLEGETCDRLASEWGLETVKPSYFWTRKRWDEHRRGLGKDVDDETYKKYRREADKESRGHGSSDAEDVLDNGIGIDETGWDGKAYLPQGTVGCVVLDSTGTLCVATSTGGLTNKLPGRIGDTPTLGAGFWSEEWHTPAAAVTQQETQPSPLGQLAAMISDCVPGLTGYMRLPQSSDTDEKHTSRPSIRGVAMSGTGNGDSFLRLNAVRTAAAMARFLPTVSGTSLQATSLQKAVTYVAGPNGTLQQSAEDRWLKTGEGEGGIIGIEVDNGRGNVVFDFNCGGMFRAWFDQEGKERMMVFRDEFKSVSVAFTQD